MLQKLNYSRMRKLIITFISTYRNVITSRRFQIIEMEIVDAAIKSEQYLFAYYYYATV